eukprot:1375913-Lingulodinium_polyedra.AAC.1
MPSAGRARRPRSSGQNARPHCNRRPCAGTSPARSGSHLERTPLRAGRCDREDRRRSAAHRPAVGARAPPS